MFFHTIIDRSDDYLTAEDKVPTSSLSTINRIG